MKALSNWENNKGVTMDNKQKGASGLATAAMVLGIIAIVGSWIPFLNIVSIIIGVLAVVFGLIPLVKKKSVGKSVTGVVLGVLSVIIAITMIVVASNAIGDAINTSDESTQKTDEKTDKNQQKRLTLDKGWKLDKSNPYATKVTGSVSNNSDKPVNGYIQVTFSALDSDKANVGDCSANANTLDANGKWKFEAICSGENIDTVRFKEISGF